MNPSGVNTDVFAILAVAQANWPHDPVAGSEAVWTKWSELLGQFRFDEVHVVLDAMVRTHPRLPPLSELQNELQTRRVAAAAAKEAARRQLSDCGEWAHRPVCLDAGYVIGPYSAAFAAMNARGWTTERLIECIRAVDLPGGEAGVEGNRCHRTHRLTAATVRASGSGGSAGASPTGASLGRSVSGITRRPSPA